MSPDIFKVETIGNGALSVMAKPVSGEWIEDDFQGMARWGVNTIVSLLEGNESYEVGLGSERDLAERNGMEFVSYSIPDRGLPSSVNDFAKFTFFLYKECSAGKNLVVHCRAGIGRTGIVVAGILIHYGYQPLL